MKNIPVKQIKIIKSYSKPIFFFFLYFSPMILHFDYLTEYFLFLSKNELVNPLWKII